jgi:colanic acid biosynthesis glycosyl transferase WcaI
MRIYLHDYAGHPFPIELSRWLAKAGHQVRHAFSADFDTPHGSLAPLPGDSPGLSIERLSLGTPLAKYDPARRLVQEYRYGRLAARRVDSFAPDVVLSANASPPIQRKLLHASRRCNAAFIAWVQDIVSLAARPAVLGRYPRLGPGLLALLSRYEYGTLARSDRVVIITEDFAELCVANGVSRQRIETVENWAPLGEIKPLPRDNSWARRNGLADKFVFLYSGTLGLKHNPALLSDLAFALRHRPEVRIVVISRGLGMQFLKVAKVDRNLDNLILFDFQPYEELSSVFASADVLVAILEPLAGVLSVPSKVLSYLCTERPLLSAIPRENLAARIIAECGAGIVVPPADRDAFIAAARDLYSDADRRSACAAAGRRYALRSFDIASIGERFLGIFENTISRVRSARDSRSASA